jgi:tungstate transport system ATP-binding protein
MTTPLVRLEKLRQRYSGRTVLRIDDFHIHSGSIVGLAGPNGSGKSTLLRLLAFLEAPAEGRILFRGRETSIRPGAVHRKVTLLMQEPYLLKRSVRANVAFGLKVRGEGRNVQSRVDHALEQVGLSPETFAARRWFELSGGETQRVAMAARLALRPEMLLMDEPTASLDEESSSRIRRAALAARDEYGAGLVVASHDMAWLRGVSDCIVHLRQGEVVDIARPGENGSEE